jgi:hypothetical protein
MCLLLQGLGGGSLCLIRDTERPRKEFYCRIDPRAPEVSGQANFWRSWINTTVELFPGSLGRNVERFWDEVQSGKQRHVNNLSIFTMMSDVVYCLALVPQSNMQHLTSLKIWKGCSRASSAMQSGSQARREPRLVGAVSRCGRMWQSLERR